ncbi:MAG TPA: hypothetical protein VET23_10515 [Chitinophagaceae bacterium]|nr:hypothetical protein [Chitinophagaceae bacterium]
MHRDYALIRRAGNKKIKSNQENRVEQVKPIGLRWRGIIKSKREFVAFISNSKITVAEVYNQIKIIKLFY